MELDEKFMDYFKHIHNNLNKVQFTYDKKKGLYVPLFNTAIRHSLSIYYLDREKLTISAFALARPAVESYLRAMWVLFNLDEDDIDEDFSQLHFPKKIETLITDIERNIPADDSFKKIKQNIELAMTNMHDFTHSGIQSIARQYDNNGNLTNQRCEEERKELRKLGVIISLLSYEKLTPLIKNIDSTEEIKSLSSELLGLQVEKQ